MSSQVGSPRRRRTRGTSAGLDLDRIVAAARSLEPDALTMQAVANALGVDRSALNHHVSDRNNLLGLVALDVFSENFSSGQFDVHDSWQEACHSYARAFTASAISAGALAGHLRPADARATKMLGPTEALLARLVEAGFDDDTGVRLLALMSNICLAFARDTVFATSTGERPRPIMLRESLAGHEHEFPHLSRISVAPPDTYGPEQLELSIDVFLRGAEALLAATQKGTHRLRPTKPGQTIEGTGRSG